MMPTFDRKLGVVNVRIVYDGPAHAGKTENLRQLHASFAPTRRGSLICPEERAGRTRFFDWLHLSGGIVAGLPLRAQLVTVPGQASLARRRWALVAAADAIVFVCESTPGGVLAGRRSLELLRAKLAAAGSAPPLVVQANKQDVQGALEPRAVSLALGLPPDTITLGASATSGGGIRETLVHAIRAAAAATERMLVRFGPEGLAASTDADELLAELTGSPGTVSGVPPLPEEDAPAGWIAPARDGRLLLRAARSRAADGVLRIPAERTIVLRAGAACFKTSVVGFATEREARDALSLAVDVRAALGALRPSDVVHSLASSTEGFWLWTTMPWLPSLEREMAAARAAIDDARVQSVLDAYARAVASSAEVANVWGLDLDIDPAHFARQGNRIVYLPATGQLPGDPAGRRGSVRRAIAKLARSAAEREEVAAALQRLPALRGIAATDTQSAAEDEA